MSNFTVHFIYPWVLLLLIPALALAFYTHFRIAKKYRRTRNRITSLVLHIAVSVLVIFALSGMSFSYTEVNTENEMIILVDMSYSNTENDDIKNEFVRSVIELSDDTNKVGVVTFGYDQVYAAPLSSSTDGMYNKFLAAPLPNITATNISGALNYARGLFKRPTSAKIVVISDGVQTDGDAATTIKSIAAEGIRVDTVYFPNTYNDSEVQIIGAQLPDYNIAPFETFEIVVSVQSTGVCDGKIVFTDNGETVKNGEREIAVVEGVQTFKFEHSFSERGLHKLAFSLTAGNDALTENNVYYAYHYIETFNNILVLTRDPAESEALKTLLEENEYTVTVSDISDAPTVPKTLDQIRLYDEVILNNIGAIDLLGVDGLDAVLHEYVNTLGGGVFTIGGDRIDEDSGKAVTNVFNRNELHLSQPYRQMLPVQAIDYTPPIGVMIIIDRSGSMGTGEGSLLEQAKQGARSALYSLSDRDYCGIMALDDSYAVEQSLLPATQQNKLISVIESIQGGGGTMYENAIWYAGRALAALSSVEKRHIILISDGQPGDSSDENYIKRIRENYKLHNITFSMICTGATSKDVIFQQAVTEGGTPDGYHNLALENSTIADALRKDLNSKAIEEAYKDAEFTPKIRDYTSVVNGIKQEDMPYIGGFYGTKAKDAATVPLVCATVTKNADDAVVAGAYVPLYAQWNYGEGKVGCFMSELSGVAGSWSENFMASETGKKIILNTVNALFPSQSIRYRDLDISITHHNYTSDINVFTSLAEGENIQVTVTGPIPDDGGQAQVRHIVPNEKDGYSRIPFETLDAGVYEVLVQKVNADGVVLCENKKHQCFSYSLEYNMFVDVQACKELMEELAATGRGAVVTEPLEVFESFVEIIDRSFDPMLMFLIMAIVLFLLDIAVRKFKWKWIHELVRDRKDKKQNQASSR